MIPPDIAATMREALERDKIRLAELVLLGLYPDNAYVDSEKARIDAALSYLDTLPAAPAPDWSAAPSWAQWWAMDTNGGAYWYEKEPKEDDYGAWSATRDAVWDDTICPNWRETLQARPTSTP